MEGGLNDAGATPQTVSEISGGNNEFAFNLYSQLADDGGKNVFFSPWSVYTALTMAYEGARGQTADEMKSVLHIPESDEVRRPSFARIHDLLNEDNEITLESANALWAQENYPFLDSYVNTIKEYYGGEVTNLDFAGNPSGTRESINDWVSEKTRGKIEDLLGPIDPLTKLILTNAVYFNGNWVKRFPEEETREENFWIGPGEAVKVPMMSMNGAVNFDYAETEDLKALKLPYDGKKLSMLILLPKTKFGLDNLEKSIDTELLENIRGKLDNREVVVHIPKFELKIKYNLEDPLKQLGMNRAFSMERANFSGMTSEEPFFLLSAVHEAYVKVDEKGTEAAAATAVSAGIGVIPRFRADRPFMFLIQHEETGVILFMGAVRDPS